MPSVGTVWLEISTGRRIRILEEEVYGTGPAWCYINVNGQPEGDSAKHPDWIWHYCDIADFILWGRFTPEY